MSTEPTRTDETTAVDLIARLLCDRDQAEIPSEQRETMEQTGYAAEFRDDARAVLAASERFWRDRLSGEIATQRVTHVPVGREAYGEGWNDAVAHLATAVRGSS